jgi:hypothetical protein
LLGYAAYLLSSLALIPVAFALRERFIAANINPTLVDTITFFGAAGAILKTLGIVRWLAAMPLLSAQYATATTTDAKNVLEIAYLALNGYAGSVGELLGVQLVSGIWITACSILLIRHFNSFWTGSLGLVAGIGFVFLTARIFFPEVAAMQSVINPLGLIWLIALGILLLRRSSVIAR